MTNTTKALLDLEDLAVVMTTVTSNTGPHPRYISLRVTDETSGQLVAEISIPPDQLINFLGNGSAKASGRVNVNGHRLGKEHQHEMRTVEIPREFGAYGERPGHPLVLAAQEKAYAEGWETAEYRFAHGKHSLVLRRWV